jgi:WD40 repeat protein
MTVEGDIALVWTVWGDGEPLCKLGCKDPQSQNLFDIMFSADGRRVLVCNEWEWRGQDLDTGQEVVDQELSVFRTSMVSQNGRVAVRSWQPLDGEGGERRVAINRYEAGDWGGERNWAVRFPPPWNENGLDFQWAAGQLLSPDGNRMAISHSTEKPGMGQSDFQVQVIDTAGGGLVGSWRGEVPDFVYLAAISQRNQIALLGDDYSSFHVIDTTRPDSELVTKANASRKHFTAAAFSPDGKLLATTSNDTTVTMWDTATWQPIRQYAWEIGKLRAVAFAPDGLTCAAGSDTGKVVLFDVDG